MAYPLEPGVDRAPGRKLKVPSGGTPWLAAEGPLSTASSLSARLHSRFCEFQKRAKTLQDRVASTGLSVSTNTAETLLEEYSCNLAAEVRRARDELREGRWQVDEEVQRDHDALCFCLAVWELAHEVAVCSAPSAPRILHWYTRHYLEEDVAEWWQTAQVHADDPSGLVPQSPLWDALCRLALADGSKEVCELLDRAQHAAGGNAAQDKHVAHFCEFLRKVPSLRQMDDARASETEYVQAMRTVREMAKTLAREIPDDHPIQQLLEIYGGASQDDFDAGKDVAKKYARTWIEDLVFVHAWVLPNVRRTQLGDLLERIAQRRVDEEIDVMDKVIFAVLTIRMSDLLQLMGTVQERFPTLVVTHLVDVLYFAGRLPVALESDAETIPPRDWHLMTYAQELMSGPRKARRFAIDYLRAGGSASVTGCLHLATEQYCASSVTEEELEESLAVLEDLNLSGKFGAQVCRRRARELRSTDTAGCIRWACRAEQYESRPRGYFVSELLDDFAEENLEALLSVLSPPGRDEPLTRYPPAWLSSLLGSCPTAASQESTLAPSGRLYFYVQYARCRALRTAGPPSAYAPSFVHLLSYGVVPTNLAKVLLDELLPVLTARDPALSVEEVLLLMRYVQSSKSDPLRRVDLSNPELQRALGTCFSQAILKEPTGVQAGALLPALEAHGTETWMACS